MRVKVSCLHTKQGTPAPMFTYNQGSARATIHKYALQSNEHPE